MKFFAIIIGITLLSYASAQNCSVADYSNITLIANALNASLNGTRNLINLIPNVYLYSGYSDYWSDMTGQNLNMFGNNFAYMAGNATASLLAVFRNFTLVASNTSANSNESLTNLQTLIRQTMITIIPLSSADSNYAMQLAQDINTQLMNLNGFITNLMMNAAQLGYAGLPPSASNILGVLPSPLLVTGLIAGLQNVTNVYIRFMNASAANINNLYNVFKSSDPTLRAWDLLKNQTVNNWTLITNTTQGSINATFVNFTKQANTMYNTYVSRLPAALKNNANFQSSLESGQSMLASFNSSLQSFQDQFSQTFDMIRMQISSLDQQFASSVFSAIKMYRQQIFTNYQMNTTTLNCSIAMLNASEAFWKSYGGPANFFNCSTNENGLVQKLVPFLQAFFTTFNQDLNAALADMQRCLSVKNITTDPNASGMQYTMQQCIENTAQSISMMSSSLSTFSSGIQQIVMGMLSGGYSRVYSCFMDTMNGLYAMVYPILNNYFTCVSKTMGS